MIFINTCPKTRLYLDKETLGAGHRHNESVYHQRPNRNKQSKLKLFEGKTKGFTDLVKCKGGRYTLSRSKKSITWIIKMVKK